MHQLGKLIKSLTTILHFQSEYSDFSDSEMESSLEQLLEEISFRRRKDLRSRLPSSSVASPRSGHSNFTTWSGFRGLPYLKITFGTNMTFLQYPAEVHSIRRPVL